MKLNIDVSNLGFNPLIKWTISLIVMSSFFILIGYPHFGKAISNDDSGITWAIMFLFLIGIIGSAVQAYKLRKDYIFLKYYITQYFSQNEIKRKLPQNFNSLPLAKLLSKFKVSIEQDLTPDHNGLVQSHHIRQNSTNRLLSTLSTLLVTLGLIGTIVGLIYAVAGLNDVIQHVGASKEDLMAGLGKTIRGMGTAFYTTFLGALSGGIMLKVLCVNNATSLAIISSCLRDFLELDLLPYLSYQKTTGETPAGQDLKQNYRDIKDTLESRMKANMELLKLQFDNYHESMETIEGDIKKFHSLFGGLKSHDWDERLLNFTNALSTFDKPATPPAEKAPISKPKTTKKNLKPRSEYKPS